MIKQLSAVEQCALVGIPDEKWGEKVHAEVILKPDNALCEEEVIAHCKNFSLDTKSPSQSLSSTLFP